MDTNERKVWHDAALDLAKATWPLVNRFDARGGYYYHRGEDCIKTTTRKDGLTKQHFVEHFQARYSEDVIGLHCLNPETNSGRFIVIDIDAHHDDDCPEANERYAVHLYDTLAHRGVRVLPFTWDDSGYHCWLIFSSPVPGHKLHAFACNLANQAEYLRRPPDVFPVQSHLTSPYGSWARLLGMHPKHRTWPKVYDGEAWRSGQAAVDTVLGGLK